ncbi:hypothetical protein [Actinosynnema sp. NPDC023587]|uniref:hypothetical protein n=1 Tax=Actinosynnema sp. NPDC023587 TaxID=3154695 RepID=UPI0033F052A6
MTGEDDRWRSLTPSLLLPELLDPLRGVPLNADDDIVPSIVFSPDNALWGLSWVVLPFSHFHRDVAGHGAG